MENPKLHGLVIQAVSKEVQGELKQICSNGYNTILKMKCNVALENFPGVGCGKSYRIKLQLSWLYRDRVVVAQMVLFSLPCAHVQASS